MISSRLPQSQHVTRVGFHALLVVAEFWYPGNLAIFSNSLSYIFSQYKKGKPQIHFQRALKKKPKVNQQIKV